MHWAMAVHLLWCTFGTTLQNWTGATLAISGMWASLALVALCEASAPEDCVTVDRFHLCDTVCGSASVTVACFQVCNAVCGSTSGWLL